MLNKNKYKIINLIKTKNTYSKQTHTNNVHGGGKKPRQLKIKKQSGENIIKNVRNLQKQLKTE